MQALGSPEGFALRHPYTLWALLICAGVSLGGWALAQPLVASPGLRTYRAPPPHPLLMRPGEVLNRQN